MRTKRSIKRILGSIRRISRRRGFGIHSPFAYRFVRQVISQKYAYYCYPYLTALSKQWGVSPRLLRLIFRISLFLRPGTMIVTGHDPQPIAEAVKAGSPGVLETESSADLIIATGNAAASLLRQCIMDGGCVVVSGSSDDCDRLQNVWQEFTFGMLFRGSKTAIAIGKRHLPHLKYNVWI